MRVFRQHAFVVQSQSAAVPSTTLLHTSAPRSGGAQSSGAPSRPLQPQKHDSARRATHLGDLKSELGRGCDSNLQVHMPHGIDDLQGPALFEPRNTRKTRKGDAGQLAFFRVGSWLVFSDLGSRAQTMRIRFQGYDPQCRALQRLVAIGFREHDRTMGLLGRCAT